MSRFVLIAVAMLVAACSMDRADAAESADPAAARDELSAAFGEQLEQLAGWCDGRGLAEEAGRTRAWAAPLDPRRLYIVDLPAAPRQPPAGEESSADAREWQDRYYKARTAQAAALFDLARQAARGKRASLAVELLLEAARQDPDHEAARRVLGYQLFRGEWRTAYERKKLAAGHVWHAEFGWLPKNHSARYEAGERLAGGRWVWAEEDARLHSDIISGWKIETEHYRVTTDHSLQAAAHLGKQLESLHRVWRWVFLGYYASDAQVAALFEGRGAKSLLNRRHEAVFFRDQEEYRQALKGSVPETVVTTGIYLGQQRTAYFYPGAEGDDSTVFHEAGHQLFNETRPVAGDIGRTANFAIVEGIACYLESLARRDGCFTLGGTDAVRYQDARFRLLEDDFYVPLAELSRLGMAGLQRDERIAMLYSQSAGLAHFLMHHEDGRYRDALIRWLVAVYTGRAATDTLAALTGEPYTELDRQYREFLEQGAPAPAAQPAAGNE